MLILIHDEFKNNSIESHLPKKLKCQNASMITAFTLVKKPKTINWSFSFSQFNSLKPWITLLFNYFKIECKNGNVIVWKSVQILPLIIKSVLSLPKTGLIQIIASHFNIIVSKSFRLIYTKWMIFAFRRWFLDLWHWRRFFRLFELLEWIKFDSFNVIFNGIWRFI